MERYKQKNKLETKVMTTSSQCNTGRICVTFPIVTTEKKIFPAYTRCSVAPIVAPPIENFQNCSMGWNVLFFRKKTMQTASKSAYKLMLTLCLLEVSQLGTKAVDGRGALQTKKEKNKLETKAMPLLRQCNTGRISVTSPIITT